MSALNGISAEHSVRAAFMAGFRDILPIIIATIPFGMVFGALAVEHLSIVETMMMSGAVYGGASQFVAIDLWADPLPFWTILMSALAVNLRHVLYSAALGRGMTHWSPATRYVGFAFMTDPTFALAEAKGPRLSPAYYFGLSLPLYVNWIATTVAGAALGNLIRNPQAIGLDFVVTAYFMFLIVGYRARPNALPVIAASATAALLAYITIGSPWHFATGALAGMAVAALLAKPGSATA
jgi:4-azaleucine resistance transporter AzlC